MKRIILLVLLLMLGCTTTPLKYRVTYYGPHYGYPSYYYSHYYRNYQIRRIHQYNHHHHYYPRPIKYKHYIDYTHDKQFKNNG